MKNYEGRLAGILGTVIIHLIAGIIFMSLQIKSIKREPTDGFLVEFAPVEPEAVKDKVVELPVTSIEKILKGDDEMMNIARNLANKTEEKINPDDYIDKVKEELIKSGRLGSDNYIDEKKRLAERKTEDKEVLTIDSVKQNDNDKPKDSQQMAANYKGPTRIYYDLTGRTHTYLPIPIYKCQGSGKVALAIEVNQNGIVEKVVVIENQSSTSDECLIETAVTTAYISRFNSDYKSPKTQSGTLSYQFVAQ